MKSSLIFIICIAAMFSARTTSGDDFRHWIARVGIHPIAAEPHDPPALEASNGVAASLGATYLFSNHWAVEVFAALPAELTLRREDDIGTFDIAPVSVTAQYHISTEGNRLRAYVGLGFAYTFVIDEHESAGRALNLEDTSGLTALVGLDMNLGRRWFATVDARWFDIDSAVSLDARSLGRVQIDPLAFGLSIGRRLR